MNGPAASFQHEPRRPPTACRAESPGHVRLLIVSRLQPVYDNSSSHRASSGGFLAALAAIRLQEHQELPLGQIGKDKNTFWGGTSRANGTSFLLKKKRIRHIFLWHCGATSAFVLRGFSFVGILPSFSLPFIPPFLT